VLSAMSVLLLARAACPATAEPTAAIVSGVQGRAVIARADRTFAAARAGTPLHLGDQVRLAPGARVTVVFPDRPRATWTGGSAGATFAVRTVSPPKGNVWGRIWRFVLSKLSPGRVASEPAATRGRVCLERLEPLNSKERRSPVTLSWGAAPGGTFEVQVLDADGNALWKAEKLTACRAEYPADAPGLKPGVRYYWRVTAACPDGKETSPLVWFELLTEKQRARVEAELARFAAGAGQLSEAEKHLYRSALLGSFGLAAESRQELALARAAETDRSLDPLIKTLGE
jgi:hypothetical protein